MGTFSSGTGLISGFDIEGYVTQIMEIEGANRDNYVDRLSASEEEQDALIELQSLVISVQTSVANFNSSNIFEGKIASSSNEDVLTATAKTWAATGTYQFVVKSLATNHQFVTRNSYSSRDSSVGTGTLSLEVGQGQLAKDIDLNLLNGRTGVQRGTFEITDKSGTTAVIDITTALSVNDIIDAINDSDADVTASVSEDGLVITDNSGGDGNLIIEDIGSGQTAADLGIAKSTSESRIIGDDIISLSEYTLLSELNDGNGVRDLSSGITVQTYNKRDVELNSYSFNFSDTITDKDGESYYVHALNSGSGVRLGKFQITDRNGQTAIIDVSNFDQNNTKISELVDEINRQATDAGLDLTFTYENQSGITVTDNSEGSSTTTERKSDFIIEDLEGGNTAADLGIADDTSGGTITGETIWSMETVGDMLAAINYRFENGTSAESNFFTASIAEDGNGITITAGDDFINDETFSITSSGSTAEDLGIETGDDYISTLESFTGKDILAGLNTVLLSSLNGGSGGDTTSDEYGSSRIMEGGIVSITDGDGNTSEIDLTEATTVQDVIDAFNNLYNDDNTTNITASINSAGNGITLTDSSSSGSMTIADTGDSNIAELLNLSGNGSGSINSGNLQLQYVSEATLISDLRNGEGVTLGTITITDAEGTSKEVNLAKDSIKTVGDIIDAIEGAVTNISARINDTGDGIILYDTKSTNITGAGISVTDNSSETAAQLGLMARDSVQDEDGNYYIDGSYELTLELGGADSLDDIAQKISDSGLGITSDVIYDGTGYRLSFTSETSGRKGTVYFDAGTTTMKVDNITTAKDAVILLGDGTEDHPMLISNNTNSIKDAIYGTTLELEQASDDPVTITIDDDVDSMVEEINGFVEAYNAVMEFIAENTSFDTDTYEKGLLFADNTTNQVKNQMVSIIQQIFDTDTGAYNTLASIGITFAPLGTETSTENGETTSYATSSGLTIQFDEGTFRDAFTAESTSVSSLFTSEDTGIGDYITTLIDNLASSTVENSTLQRRIDAIDDENSLLEDRIEDLQERLDAKEERMYNEFYAMEETLAALQTQQSAISSLSSSTTSSS